MVPSFPNPNHYPFWIYSQAVLPAGAPNFVQGFKVPYFADWILLKAFIQYNSIGAAPPTTFANVRAILTDLGRGVNSKPESVAIPIMVFSTPGIYDTFNSGTTDNQSVYNAKSINRIFFARSTFQIEYTGFMALGSNITLDLVLQGENILSHPMDH